MPRALILGGTGLVGGAIARRLLRAGWQVDVTGRDPGRMPAALAADGARFTAADRHDPARLRAAFGTEADLLVDCVCYTGADARLLLPFAHASGSAVMISSKAAYVDDQGRHSNSDASPEFARPVVESQATMAPSDVDFNSREGYGANKVAAEQVLLDSGAPVTVLRPSKVHGVGGTRPREWMFVKRVLDRRPAVFLARRGAGIDHPSAAANIAALVETVAAVPGRRVLNSADPDAPSGRRIARAIARHLDYQWEEVLLDEAESAGALGRHPWDSVPPIILDMTAASELGYVPAGDYATTVRDQVDWLVSAARADGDLVRSWMSDGFFDPLLDYTAEDRYLAERGRSARP
jgi:nucleoside-diphosphate-sugar epimerase